jgi:hypothetical protein
MRAFTVASLAAFVLGLAACGGDGGSTTAQPPPPPPATTAPPPPPEPPPPPPAPKPKPSATTVRIVYRDGQVVGGLKRATVKKGEKVVLVVRSDVADHVHLHGYDKFVDVAAGTVARLAFVASLPGRFEVELEDRGLQIADIEVRP